MINRFKSAAYTFISDKNEFDVAALLRVHRSAVPCLKESTDFRSNVK